MCDTQTQTTTEATPQSLAEIVREVTDNGRIVVEFLADMVQGKMEGATYSHRLEAARQLEKLGLKIPHLAVIEAAEKAAKASKPRKQSAAPAPAAPTSKISELAEIVRLETDNGKDIVRFLVDVVQGNHEGFKEHHRLRAAIELRRCLTDVCEHTSAGVLQDSPYNHEDDPFDFDNYDEEQFMRDRDGERALRHIYGSEEAITTVRESVARFRKWVPLLEENYVPDRDFTPIDDPEEDPDGKGHYAYNALRFIFDDNRSIRVANRIYEKFKNIEDNTFKCSNHDHPDWSRDYALKTIRESLEAEYRALYEQRQPPQNPNPHVVLSEAEGPPSPDHARPSTEHNPDRPHVILERSEESPSPDREHPSTDHNPDRPNVILERSEESPSRDPQQTPTEPNEERPAPSEPPSSVTPEPGEKPPRRRRRKKIRRIIHLGPTDEEDPPDDYPRRRGDPDEIRIPLRDVVRYTAGPL